MVDEAEGDDPHHPLEPRARLRQPLEAAEQAADGPGEQHGCERIAYAPVPAPDRPRAKETAIAVTLGRFSIMGEA